jgi:ferredoxin-thioredoxin reductase catalytic subunit
MTGMNNTPNSEAIIAGFERRIQELKGEILAISNETFLKPSAESFENLELTLQNLTRELCDLVAAKRLQLALMSDDVCEEAARLIKALPQKMKNFGQRLTPVRMSNGTRVLVLTSYCARPCHEKKSEESAATLP